VTVTSHAAYHACTLPPLWQMADMMIVGKRDQFFRGLFLYSDSRPRP
jgi:hypothetical protein